MKEETEQKETDVQYKLECERARIPQFKGHGSPRPTRVDRILRREEWLKAGIEMVRDQLMENLQVDLHDYLNMAFVALETPTNYLRGGYDGSVSATFTRITDGLQALVESIEGLCGPPAVAD